MDILEALADEAPARSAGGCKIQRWLDGIDPETPGLADLVVTIETSDPTSERYRTLQQTTRVLGRLGLTTTYFTVGHHRAKRCRCFD